MSVPRLLSRRVAGAALVVAPALVLGLRAQEAKRRATPAQTEGPFYPLQLPADQDADLLRTGSSRYERGEPATIAGTLTDLQGRPLAGSVVGIWQCDADGHYHHPGDGGRADPAFQGFGRMQAAFHRPPGQPVEDPFARGIEGGLVDVVEDDLAASLECHLPDPGAHRPGTDDADDRGQSPGRGSRRRLHQTGLIDSNGWRQSAQ